MNPSPYAAFLEGYQLPQMQEDQGLARIYASAGGGSDCSEGKSRQIAEGYHSLTKELKLAKNEKQASIRKSSLAPDGTKESERDTKY